MEQTPCTCTTIFVGGIWLTPHDFCVFPTFLGFNQETKGIQPRIMGVEWEHDITMGYTNDLTLVT